MQIIREDWRLVVYYDTRPYSEGNKAIEKYMKYLDNICVKIQSRSHCDGVLLQLRHEYFFFCCEPFLIKLVCNDRIIPLQLTTSGFFSIDEGCTIKSSDFVAFSHRQKESRLDLLYNILSPEISQINNIINITLPSVSVNYTSDFTRNHTAQLQDIQRNIEFMKNTEPLAEMSNHDIHHYAAIYILFALVGLGGAVWLCRRFRCSSRRESGAPAPTPVPERGPEAGPATPATPALQCSVQQVQCSEVKGVCDKSACVLVKETPRFNVPDGYLNTSTV
ncbi:unnamed protein product [Euphydryas editha]|uniref:Uncharacterized protein n=1 Tax=Euphydryas editha TaxID=104508 RepID=A0AAU9VCR4_EUPED|nr:unnamed protein product [Euphydryas editha]